MFNKNKRGSYLVEASITLPILIISICSLILIIKIMTICENITFTTSNKMIDIMLCNYSNLNIITLCDEVKDTSNNITDFKIKKFKYLFDDEELEDLIALETQTNFRVFNAIGIDGNISFDEKILCRKFTGKLQQERPLNQSEFLGYIKSVDVYIFPRYGEKYHSNNCKYIKQNDLEEACVIKMDKEDAWRKGYEPCIICQGAAYEQ